MPHSRVKFDVKLNRSQRLHLVQLQGPNNSGLARRDYVFARRFQTPVPQLPLENVDQCPNASFGAVRFSQSCRERILIENGRSSIGDQAWGQIIHH